VEAVSRERALLLAILVAAFALRLAHLLSQHGDVLFEHPMLDEERYVDSARALAAGHDEARPYWQPPGIVYVTAAVLRVCGPSLWGPRLLQVLISTAACLLLYLLGRRLFSPRVALAATAILALHGVVVHAGGELLPGTWILFFDLLALLLLEQRRAFFAGLTLGVAALFSPVILPFTVAGAVWLKKPAAIALLVLGVILPVAPVTLRNHAHGGHWVLVSTNGGLNLFLGNNRQYRELFPLRPGRQWEQLTSLPRTSDPAAASSYFSRAAWEYAQAQPRQAAKTYLRKLYLYFNGAEIPRDSRIEGGPTVWVWPPFPDGILIPLALMGVALSWRERRRLALIHAFVACQAVVTALFFVSARHRLPSLPLFALLAAAGASQLRAMQPRWLPPLLALLVVCNWPVWESSLTFPGEADFYRGVASLRELHDPAAASGYFRLAAAANPKDARAWFELGNALEQLGRSGDAVEAYRQAAALDGSDSRARRRMAASLMKSGDLDGAADVLREQVQFPRHEPAHYAPDYLNLAFVQAQRGDLAAAREAWNSAKSADPEWFAAHAERMASQLPPETRQQLQGP
jgi:4-amino-4-deoxy-L-arabinose transferase-like glycosyltransferase